MVNEVFCNKIIKSGLKIGYSIPIICPLRTVQWSKIYFDQKQLGLRLTKTEDPLIASGPIFKSLCKVLALRHSHLESCSN